MLSVGKDMEFDVDAMPAQRRGHDQRVVDIDRSIVGGVPQEGRGCFVGDLKVSRQRSALLKGRFRPKQIDD